MSVIEELADIYKKLKAQDEINSKITNALETLTEILPNPIKELVAEHTHHYIIPVEWKIMYGRADYERNGGQQGYKDGEVIGKSVTTLRCDSCDEEVKR